MLQVLQVGEPSLELSTVFQLHRILITHTLCFYSVILSSERVNGRKRDGF